MGDCNDQTDEEIILRDEASDQALEAASGATGGYPTLAYGTYCFTCPSSAAKLLTRDEAQRIATAPNDPPLGQIIRRHFDLNTIAGHNLNAMVQEPARDDPSIRERTGEGRKRAMAAGIKFGRKRKLSDYQRAEAIKRRAAGETLASIAKSYGVHLAMISRL